jgi:uncharacterized protein
VISAAKCGTGAGCTCSPRKKTVPLMKHYCPICKKPTDSETDADFPFCSERCRLLDLGNWSAEKYKISRPAFDEDMLEELLNENPPRKHEPED